MISSSSLHFDRGNETTSFPVSPSRTLVQGPELDAVLSRPFDADDDVRIRDVRQEPTPELEGEANVGTQQRVEMDERGHVNPRNDDSDDEKQAAFDPRVDELDDDDAEMSDFEALPPTAEDFEVGSGAGSPAGREKEQGEGDVGVPRFSTCLRIQMQRCLLAAGLQSDVWPMEPVFSFHCLVAAVGPRRRRGTPLGHGTTVCPVAFLVRVRFLCLQENCTPPGT